MPAGRATTIAVLAFAVAVGAAVGVGGFTFVYAKGHSYLSNDPATCANCHVMQAYVDGWVKSSHRNVAVCNDCHLAPGMEKWLTKASNGFFHSLAFTTGDFPDPLLIKPGNRDVAERKCRYCHEPIVAQMDTTHRPEDRVSCIRCHGAVGHPTLVAPAATPAR